MFMLKPIRLNWKLDHSGCRLGLSGSSFAEKGAHHVYEESRSCDRARLRIGVHRQRTRHVWQRR